MREQMTNIKDRDGEAKKGKRGTPSRRRIYNSPLSVEAEILGDRMFR